MAIVFLSTYLHADTHIHTIIFFLKKNVFKNSSLANESSHLYPEYRKGPKSFGPNKCQQDQLGCLKKIPVNTKMSNAKIGITSARSHFSQVAIIPPSSSKQAPHSALQISMVVSCGGGKVDIEGTQGPSTCSSFMLFCLRQATCS